MIGFNKNKKQALHHIHSERTIRMSLFYSNPLCDPQTFTLSGDSKISLSKMGLASPLKAAVVCLQSLSRNPDERQCRAAGIITKTGIVFNPEPATCASLVFRDGSHM